MFWQVFFVAYIPNDVSAQKVISLNYANFFPAPHKHSVLGEQWCKEIEKRTNGRVKIGTFPDNILSSAIHIYDGVVRGALDIGFSTFVYTMHRKNEKKWFLQKLAYCIQICLPYLLDKFTNKI